MRNLGLILFIWLIPASVALAQSKAYAKFDGKGSTIGLYNLLAETNGCEEGRVILGMISKVTFEVNEAAYSYTFTVNGGGRIRTVKVRIENGEILRPDLERLVAPRRRVRVVARPCGNGEVWAAEEIRRL